jgi:hypothetical protein
MTEEFKSLFAVTLSFTVDYTYVHHDSAHKADWPTSSTMAVEAYDCQDAIDRMRQHVTDKAMDYAQTHLNLDCSHYGWGREAVRSEVSKIRLVSAAPLYSGNVLLAEQGKA